VFEVPANEIADELGNTKVANIVMLGAYLAEKRILPVQAVKNSFEKVLPQRHHQLIPLNIRALERGLRLTNR